MNAATRLRYALAERIAASYAHDPNARVVMIAGSVGRGVADRYSDVEIDVYYERPPTMAERIAAIERCGGQVDGLDEDADEWAEEMIIDGFHAATSTFLIATMERYLRDVLERCLLAPAAQTRIYSLQHAVTVKDDVALVEPWRARAAVYPDGLQRTMLEEYLPFEGFWYAEDMLVARDDLLLLYTLFTRIGRELLGALLGLNRLYLPTPDHIKHMDEMIGTMALKPPDLSARLKRSFRVEPTVGVQSLKALIAETLDLVDQHVPGFDTAPYRANFGKQRQTWDIDEL